MVSDVLSTATGLLAGYFTSPKGSVAAPVGVFSISLQARLLEKQPKLKGRDILKSIGNAATDALQTGCGAITAHCLKNVFSSCKEGNLARGAMAAAGAVITVLSSSFTASWARSLVKKI